MLRNLLLFTLVLVAVAGLAACGGQTTPASTPAATSPAASPTSTPTQTAGDPAAQFAELCAGCHKADGSGGFGPDLRGEDDTGRVAKQISSGGSSMPAFSGDLTDAQIQALADYVVSEL